MIGIKRCVFIYAALIVLVCGACAENGHVYEERNNTAVLMYHHLLEGNTVPTENTDIITNAEKFENDIKALLDSGYKPISLYDLYKNKNDGGKYFAITFDDGYLSNYEIAYPILKKYNCYADIFINTDNEYMEHHFSFEQAREMEKSGLIAVHSHFTVHEDVRDYSDEDFARVLEKSFKTLEDNLGKREYRFFSYPYGYYNDKTYETAVNSGVNLQFIQRRNSDSGLFILRTSIAYETDIAEMLKTAYMN